MKRIASQLRLHLGWLAVAVVAMAAAAPGPASAINHTICSRNSQPSLAGTAYPSGFGTCGSTIARTQANECIGATGWPFDWGFFGANGTRYGYWHVSGTQQHCVSINTASIQGHVRALQTPAGWLMQFSITY